MAGAAWVEVGTRRPAPLFSPKHPLCDPLATFASLRFNLFPPLASSQALHAPPPPDSPAQKDLAKSATFVMLPPRSLTEYSSDWQFEFNCQIMKTILIALLTAISMHSSYAGADGTAVIKGRSGTGRTQIEIHTSDVENGVKYLKYTIDGKSYEFNLREEKPKETYGYIVHDWKNQVFTIFVDNKKIDLKFWMIPGTRKTENDSQDCWSFFAYVEGTDPREFSEETRNHPLSPRIYLHCTRYYNL